MVIRVPKQLIGIVTVLIVVVVAFLLFAKTPQTAVPQSPSSEATVLLVTAKAGFLPNSLIAPAGKPVILRIKTTNTYDCSAAFKITELGVDMLLPPNGETDFQIPAQQAGKVMAAGCSMGMYDLKITFQ